MNHWTRERREEAGSVGQGRREEGGGGERRGRGRGGRALELEPFLSEVRNIVLTRTIHSRERKWRCSHDTTSSHALRLPLCLHGSGWEAAGSPSGSALQLCLLFLYTRTQSLSLPCAPPMGTPTSQGPSAPGTPSRCPQAGSERLTVLITRPRTDDVFRRLAGSGLA